MWNWNGRQSFSNRNDWTIYHLIFRNYNKMRLALVQRLHCRFRIRIDYFRSHQKQCKTCAFRNHNLLRKLFTTPIAKAIYFLNLSAIVLESLRTGLKALHTPQQCLSKFGYHFGGCVWYLDLRDNFSRKSRFTKPKTILQ